MMFKKNIEKIDFSSVSIVYYIERRGGQYVNTVQYE